jgi:hypothetical protein
MGLLAGARLLLPKEKVPPGFLVVRRRSYKPVRFAASRVGRPQARLAAATRLIPLILIRYYPNDAAIFSLL